MAKEQKIIILTGKPAGGKTTIGRLMEKHLDFACIEGDDFITEIGKTRLNNGRWDDTDRRIYLTRMAASAIEAVQEHSQVVIADCLTTCWMREFVLRQIRAIFQNIAVGFILIERELTDEQIQEIAQTRSAQGHVLDIEALLRFRQAFEPWDKNLGPCIKLHNPGNGSIESLIPLITTALAKL